MRIDIEDAEIEYYVKDVLSTTDSQDQLLVYEWVWLNYYDSDSNPDVMGFGTDHVITLTKGETGYSIDMDSYEEITGFSEGTDGDFKILESIHTYNGPTDREDFEALYTLDDEDLYDLYAVDSTYNPSDAAAFAQEYAGHKSSGISSGTQHPSGYCPYVYYYDNDCANFVSQCLRAGGLNPPKLQDGGAIHRAQAAHSPTNLMHIVLVHGYV